MTRKCPSISDASYYFAELVESPSIMDENGKKPLEASSSDASSMEKKGKFGRKKKDKKKEEKDANALPPVPASQMVRYCAK